MRKDDPVRLRHMLDASREAVSFIENKNKSSLDSDRVLVLGLVKSIEIIGEAAANVTKECQYKLPQIPWQNIISMRNRLIHAYFDIDWISSGKQLLKISHPLIAELEKVV